MNRIFLTFILAIGAICSATAQGAWDGLILSQTQYEGTARFTAMGGAFAALGGDFTTLSINPAGIGVYRGTEFTFSLALNHGNTSADYLSTTSTDSYTNLSVNNLGVVFGSTRASEGLVSLNWGVGYNKLHTVTNRHTAVHGTSANSSQFIPSMLASIANEMEGIDYHNLDEGKAIPLHLFVWDNRIRLVDLWGNSDTNYVAVTDNVVGVHPDEYLVQRGTLKQTYYAEQTGYTGEYVFSIGGNVSDKFYFGATFGIQSIRKEYYKKYTETAEDPSKFRTTDNKYFNSFTHTSWLNTSGTGYNIKLGVIWRPVAGLRWGAYFHSPTWTYLTDKYSERMDADFSNGDWYNSDVPSNTYDYKTVTPVKWGTGLAYTFGSQALISVEYEGTDYSALKMYGYESNHYVRLSDVDDEVRANFKMATNIRAGGEYRINQYALRAGYSYYGSPVKNNDSFARHIIAAGAGYQWGGGFIDATYSFSPGNEEIFSLYAGSNNVKNTNFAGKIIVTLGFRF
jgi:hypothetical protein